jgi:hypothetical protein
MEAKEPIELADDIHLRQSQLDVKVDRIGRNSGAKLAFPPACFFRLENCSAALTMIPMEAVTNDPPLNAMSQKFEIDDGLAVLPMLEELRRGALRARVRPRTLEVVRSYGF